MKLFWCLILGFVSLSVYKAKTVWLLNAANVSINVSNIISIVHFFGMLKKKHIYTKCFS